MVRVVMAAKTSPEQGYSVDELTRIMGVNRRTLVARLKGATPVKGGSRQKLYRLSDAVQGFISQPLRGREADEMAEVRRRKLEAETGLAELKLQRERGEVVSHRDLVDDFVGLFRDFHLRFTVALPQQLAPRLQAKTSAQAEAILREELGEALQEFRRECARQLDAPDGDEGLGQEEVSDDEA
jgi:transcriptional regulator with XRE-family HTH domain